MSLESKVGRAFLDVGDIIKTNVIGALSRARSEGKFTCTDSDLSVIANIVDQSVELSVRQGVDAVLRLIK